MPMFVHVYMCSGFMTLPLSVNDEGTDRAAHRVLAVLPEHKQTPLKLFTMLSRRNVSLSIACLYTYTCAVAP